MGQHHHRHVRAGLRRGRTALGLRVAAAAVGIAAAVVGLAAAASSAAATSRTGPAVRPGLGHWVDGHGGFVGFYRALVAGRWVKVYCVSPGRRSPDRITLHTVGRVRGTSTAVTRLLAETLAAHGDARTATQAAAVSQALNEEIGNHAAVARRARQLPRAVQSLAAEYVREARSRHATHALSLRASGSPLPGQAGTASVELRSAGHGVAGTVLLAHTGNVVTPRAVRTDGSGHARFGYRTVGGGPVRITATARPAPATVRASIPTSSTQQMLSWSAPAAVRASVGYQGTGAGFGHRYSCTDECAGHPVTTLTACAPASGYPARLTFLLAGRSHDVDFAASRVRVCRSWSLPLADGVTVSAAWRYRTPTGWSAPIEAAGRFTVDCPAAPPVAVALGADCTAATLAVTLGRQVDGILVPVRNGSRHRMVLLVSGAAGGRYEVPPGGTAAVQTFGVRCGRHATVSVRGGVQRAGGGWNWGGPLEVVVP